MGIIEVLFDRLRPENHYGSNRNHCSQHLNFSVTISFKLPLQLQHPNSFKAWWTFRIYFYFFCSGEAKAESEAAGREGGRGLGGGGSRRRGGGRPRGPGGCLRGIGGGRLNIFLGGRNSHQENGSHVIAMACNAATTFRMT